jgi:hypothetical protein
MEDNIGDPPCKDCIALAICRTKLDMLCSDPFTTLTRRKPVVLTIGMNSASSTKIFKNKYIQTTNLNKFIGEDYENRKSK